ncbi:MAG TPA: hypothetical protein VK137_13150, partial [Planctomycetaceae bacterium]|nr:hypothetical protein [Planctomycetaceae bacterium]
MNDPQMLAAIQVVHSLASRTAEENRRRIDNRLIDNLSSRVEFFHVSVYTIRLVVGRMVKFVLWKSPMQTSPLPPANVPLPTTCLPTWGVAELPEPKPLGWRNWASFIGPGIVMMG